MQSVLLLDDDPLNLQWLQILVGRLSGVQALAFQDPQEALACARAQPLD
ncbi:MAG: two-component system response regulator, partial [Betaproteobacteria bacterium]|nr:two-component system response regulator [Betaproteobacteria bacterium]